MHENLTPAQQHLLQHVLHALVAVEGMLVSNGGDLFAIQNKQLIQALASMLPTGMVAKPVGWVFTLVGTTVEKGFIAVTEGHATAYDATVAFIDRNDYRDHIDTNFRTPDGVLHPCDCGSTPESFYEKGVWQADDVTLYTVEYADGQYNAWLLDHPKIAGVGATPGQAIGNMVTNSDFFRLQWKVVP